MRQTYQIIILIVFVVVACNSKKTDKTQWTSLFNGKDLEGWVVKISGYPLGENFGNTFRVENEILSVRYDAYDSFNNRFGGLHFERVFSDFRLKVEYRFVGEAAVGAPSWGFRDSGIQYHGQDPKSMAIDQPFPVCLEYNLHGGNGTDDRPVGQICANGIDIEMNGEKIEAYCTPPTVNHTFHGDQWVTLEIESKGGVFKHFVNGEEIIKFENPQYDPEHRLGKLFFDEADSRVKQGYISLQSNSHPIDFRKIEIVEL